MKPFSPQKV